MIQLHGIKARVVRLDELARALRKEIVTIKDADDPLLYLERKQYLNAMLNALAGLEEARLPTP